MAETDWFAGFSEVPYLEWDAIPSASSTDVFFHGRRVRWQRAHFSSVNEVRKTVLRISDFLLGIVVHASTDLARPRVIWPSAFYGNVEVGSFVQISSADRSTATWIWTSNAPIAFVDFFFFSLDLCLQPETLQTMCKRRLPENQLRLAPEFLNYDHPQTCVIGWVGCDLNPCGKELLHRRVSDRIETTNLPIGIKNALLNSADVSSKKRDWTGHRFANESESKPIRFWSRPSSYNLWEPSALDSEFVSLAEMRLDDHASRRFTVVESYFS